MSDQQPTEEMLRSAREAYQRKPRARQQPLGRTEELREKETQRLQEREGLYYGSAAPRAAAPRAKKKQKKERHTALWAITAVICLCGIVSLLVLLVPQLMGIRYRTMNTYAFAGGMVLPWSEDAEARVLSEEKTLSTDTFYPGVYVDGLDLGGMTPAEARTALSEIPAMGGGEFSVEVQVDQQTWTIDSTQVPLTRNTEETLGQAWSYGRQNTAGAQTPPLSERAARAAGLAADPVYLNTSLSYDKTLIRALVDQIVESVTVQPVSAGVAAFDLNTKTFSFTADVSGRAIDGEALYRAVMDVLDSDDPWGKVAFTTTEVIAPVTKAELMSAFQRISSFSTTTTNNKNRNTNVELSARAINGVVVQPGETFSFNRTVGERTAEKGYREATAISGGQNIEEIGGGVCQTSSTLFNAAARANMEIVKRSPHAWPSSYIAKGLDATVNWPGLDFQFKNTSEWPVYIVAWYEKQKVTCELYGFTLGEGVTIELESMVTQTLEAPKGVNLVENPSLPRGTRKTTVKARKGYVVETWQVWYRGGVEFDRKLLCTSTYKAYQETVEYN